LKRRPIPLRIDPPAQPLGAGGYGCVHPSHHRLWHRAYLHRRRRGMSDVQPSLLWSTLAETRQHRSRPAVSSRLFRFHRWLANLRVRKIEEVKSVPYAPVSHPFVERLIGTLRREYLDRAFFWNALDLARKLEAFRSYYNGHRVHRALAGFTPEQRAGAPSPAAATLEHCASSSTARICFRSQLPLDNKFATLSRHH
jgi:hypothetical protein